MTEETITCLRVVKRDGKVYIEQFDRIGEGTEEFPLVFAPIEYTGQRATMIAANEAVAELSRTMAAARFAANGSNGCLTKVSLDWGDDKGAEEVEIGLASGSKGHELHFRDGRNILLSSREYLAFALFALHSASMHIPLARNFRSSLIANFAGDFLRVASNMQKKLDEIVKEYTP